MNYNLEINDIIPDEVEKDIITLLNKKAPSCYAIISEKEKLFLEKNIINHNNYKKYNITYDIIKSIRSSYIKNKMIKRHHFLIKNTNSIIKDYKEGINILEISKKYDGSPLNIMRIILLKTNSKEKVKRLFNKPELLSENDFKQFTIAKKNDDFALVNQDEILVQSNLFEKKIENVLKKNNIDYKTQEELSNEQIKIYGKPINTPDFLLKSDLKINGKNIKWIDAKNFYGSNINFVKSKINEQTKKYINNYGQGCIIFNLGFNELYLENKDILFLSWQSFNKL
jgi:hypothetical protein